MCVCTNAPIYLSNEGKDGKKVGFGSTPFLPSSFPLTKDSISKIGGGSRLFGELSKQTKLFLSFPLPFMVNLVTEGNPLPGLLQKKGQLIKMGYISCLPSDVTYISRHHLTSTNAEYAL